MIQLIEEDGLYGVIEDSNVLVPPLYEDYKDAIAEWEWFEIENSNREKYRKFLSHNRTLEEIEEIKNILLNKIKKDNGQN